MKKILWLPDVKNWLLGKDPDAGKDWRQEEKGTTEDEMVGWHHRLDGLWELLMDGEACCAPVHDVHKEPDTAERLNWTEWRQTTLEQYGKEKIYIEWY